jgi:hypothetical protein
MTAWLISINAQPANERRALLGVRVRDFEA